MPAADINMQFDDAWIAVGDLMAGKELSPGTLGYVKAGPALAHAKVNNQICFEGLHCNTSDKSETFWGGSVAVGLEKKINPNWSVGVEGRYVGFGSKTTTSVAVTPGGSLVPGDTTINHKVTPSVTLVGMKINYTWCDGAANKGYSK